MTRDIHEEYDCCVSAVQTVFRHLSLNEIKQPPKSWFDAALARQISLYILVNELGWNRRRICTEFNRNRGRIRYAIDTVTGRINASPDFANAYEAISRIARSNAKGSQ